MVTYKNDIDAMDTNDDDDFLPQSFFYSMNFIHHFLPIETCE